ncbi:MAG: DUF7151 family protein [Thermoplasmata archaeon]
MKKRFVILVLLALIFFFFAWSVPLVDAVYAPPTFVAVSAFATSTGADVTITIPATWEPGDIFLVAGVVEDVDDSVTMTGYTAFAGSPFSRASASRHWQFWKRATNAESNPLFDKSTATGATAAVMAVYRGAATSGDPWGIVGASATGTTDPAPCTTITTTVDGSLIVNILTGEDDNNAAITTTATSPRAAWVEHYLEGTNGGGILVTFSEMGQQVAGATGSVSVDFDTANPIGWGCRNLSLSPSGGSGGGADGFNSLVKTTAEGVGANCANGGIKVESGLDNGDGGGSARDGVLQAGEVDSTIYVCNGAAGSAGADGFNSLVLVATEAQGANCAYPGGGISVRAGLDNGDGGGTARDGVLQVGEVDAGPFYVCNGETGATGATGATGDPGPTGPAGTDGFNSLVLTTAESAGVNCADAGLKVTSGLDNGDGGGIARDGTLQAGEVDATAYVCNGAPGAQGAAGHAALVSTAIEPPGANCAAGGVKINSGTDLNDDTILQEGEITSVSYACNGVTGSTGPSGPTGPTGPEGPAGSAIWSLFAVVIACGVGAVAILGGRRT